MIHRKMKTGILLALLSGALIVQAQETEKNTLSAIYQNALTSYESYNNLKELCSKAPGRLVGSKESELAIQILKSHVGKNHPDTCYLQNYTTPSWRCKSPCLATVQVGSKTESLHVVNLGLSVSTPGKGITGEILEVHTLGALDQCH